MEECEVVSSVWATRPFIQTLTQLCGFCICVYTCIHGKGKQTDKNKEYTQKWTKQMQNRGFLFVILCFCGGILCAFFSSFSQSVCCRRAIICLMCPCSLHGSACHSLECFISDFPITNKWKPSKDRENGEMFSKYIEIRMIREFLFGNTTSPQTLKMSADYVSRRIFETIWFVGCELDNNLMEYRTFSMHLNKEI